MTLLESLRGLASDPIGETIRNMGSVSYDIARTVVSDIDLHPSSYGYDFYSDVLTRHIIKSRLMHGNASP